MHPITIRMDRVFDVQPDAFSGNLRRTLFSFESGGKRYFSILVDGDPKLVSGQTITALLKRKDDWQTVQGIVIHETSEIFAPSVAIDIWVVLLTMFIAGIFYMDLQFTIHKSRFNTPCNGYSRACRGLFSTKRHASHFHSSNPKIICRQTKLITA
jgi:hypothetical protein